MGGTSSGGGGGGGGETLLLCRAAVMLVLPLLAARHCGTVHARSPRCTTCAAGRTVSTVREDLQHLASKYGSSAALLRLGGRPVFFVYDHYHIPADAWASLLRPGGGASVRGTQLDGEGGHAWLRGVGCLAAGCKPAATLRQCK
jgi:hypothetical protein